MNFQDINKNGNLFSSEVVFLKTCYIFYFININFAEYFLFCNNYKSLKNYSVNIDFKIYFKEELFLENFKLID